MHLYARGIFTLLFLSQFFCIESRAQSSTPSLTPGYYVVVAVYRLGQEAYAESYINSIDKEGIDAQYGADIRRKYLYVYLDYYKDFDESIKEMLTARKKTGFEQAWVRVMKDDLDTNINLLTKAESEKEQSVVIASKEKTVIIPDEIEKKAEAEIDENVSNVESKPIINEIEKEQIIEELASKENAPTLEEAVTATPKSVAAASVYLSLYNSTNNHQIEGEVEVIDVDRARLVDKVKGNENINLPDPKSKSGKISLIANVFGYRPIQHEIYYNRIPDDSTNHFIEWSDNHYVIKFGMSRYHKGDIHTLYNVFFYNDAAIMLPESKYQLNSLLTMMNENPNYRIKLHGHTNGNARGRIITMGPSKSFFSLANDVKDGTGSAKELSKQRAEVIKYWLVSQGVAADRIEIKAWGGGRMIYDKNSVNAKKNVRVDVEILEE
ncbi:MAG: OmpA family protein [Cyclobacteriaceae bacterium]|nr:OmpA family protein [Cyclobacteriaceae bacterium]